MARQSTAPVGYSRSTRIDEGSMMSSGRAGVVNPALIVPMLKEDAGSGTVAIDINLAPMPKPLLNPVFANVQAWFVPRSAHPRFAGTDEFLNAYTSTTIRALGSADRAPPPFCNASSSSSLVTSDVLKILGIHVPTGKQIDADWFDALTLIYNFRLSAHSSKLPLAKYVAESAAEAASLKPAFWPSSTRTKDMVPDYERALLLGQLDLDVAAGKLPIRGMIMSAVSDAAHTDASGWRQTQIGSGGSVSDGTVGPVSLSRLLGVEQGDALPRVWADMQGEMVTVSLSDIDKARTTQAFAKMRTAMAGNDSTGFINDQMILAYLMQGISVPPEYYRRPWLLGSRRVAFGFAERHATDGASLDMSETTGRTRVQLPISVPQQNVGGWIIVTLEVLPERIDERMSDEALLTITAEGFPNALVDIQRNEPVDSVLNRRIDAAHTSPDGLYGYEPMNAKWNRSFTRLGGIFYQPDPTTPTTESRAGIWQAGIIDPNYTEDHWLAPVPFPHDVFADTQAPAFEFVVRHNVNIVGNTQFGDVLAENNDDYEAVVDGGISDGTPG